MPPQRLPHRTLSISGDLRRRINQIAHAQGQQHEIAARIRITEVLRGIAADESIDNPSAAIGDYLKALEGA